MFKKRSRDDQSNFWISYADLMAGLLFVFILLIGAIVSKSMILREDLYKKQEQLGKTEVALMEKTDRLKALSEKLNKKEADIKKMSSSLESTKKTVSRQESIIKQDQKTIATQKEQIRLKEEEVRKLHRLLAELKLEQSQERRLLREKIASLSEDINRTNAALAQKEKRVDDLAALITLTKDELALKESELKKLNQLLLARNSNIDTLNDKIVILQNLTKESNATLQQKQKKLQEYVGRVIVLSNQLTDKESELKLKDEKLTTLLEALDEKRTKYDDLLAKLQSQKAKIKSLTGIRLKVIAELKNTLGNKIDIDRKSGALRLSSSILFDKGSSELKEESKSELRASFEEYIAALVTNEAIRPHLDRIVIEGHTDSDGTYLYNLKLSQDRALAVMNYLLTLPISQKYDLEKYLVASGRAYMDSIKKGGIEDKDASRRIEIKFQLKNRDAMHEIERILDDKQLF